MNSPAGVTHPAQGERRDLTEGRCSSLPDKTTTTSKVFHAPRRLPGQHPWPAVQSFLRTPERTPQSCHNPLQRPAVAQPAGC